MLDLVRGNLSALRCDKAALGLVGVGAMVLAVAATMGAFGAFAMFFFIGFVLVPIFGTAIGAVMISGERASGYAAVLHTAPITPAAYYGAKWLTAFLWTSLALLLTVPYGLLFALFLGPLFLAEFLPWIPVGLLLAAFSAGLGVLLSVLVGRRGLLPSAFSGIGIALAVALVPMLVGVLPEGMRDAAGWMTRLSPMVNVLDFQQGLAARSLDTEEGWKGYALVATYTALFAVLGYVLYHRFQNAEGWDARGRHVAAALAVGFVVVLAPAAIVGGNPLGPPEPVSRGDPSGPELLLTSFLLQPGQALPDFELGGIAEVGPVTLRPGEPVRMDVAFWGNQVPSEGPGPRPGVSGEPRPTPPPLTNIVVRFQGNNNFRVAVDPPEYRMAAWAAEPCPSITVGEGNRSRTITGAERDCFAYPAHVVPVTLTVTAVPSFQRGHAGNLLQVRLDSDQGRTISWTQGDVLVDNPEFPWWATFVVWAGIFLGFAAPQAWRRAGLGRKPAPASAAPTVAPPAKVVRRQAPAAAPPRR